MNQHRVFVYGTLKSSASAKNILARFGKSEGKAWTTKPFGMLTTGCFPVMVEQAPENHLRKVEGEVYLVPRGVLDMLDKYESVPVMYQRKRIRAHIEEKNLSQPAFAYVGNPEYWRGKIGASFFNGVTAEGRYNW